MKKVIAGLVAVSMVVWFAPGTAMANKQREVKEICKNAIFNKGYEGYRFQHIEVNAVRSGGYSVSGQISNGSKRFEFNCVTDERMIITDLPINPLGGTDDSSSSGSAPAETQVACAEEADKYWGLEEGTSVPGKSKATGNRMYEVEVAGGKHQGVCTVTKDGDVKSIMNR